MLLLSARISRVDRDQLVLCCRHLDSDADGCLSVSELKQALGDLGFGQRAQAAAEDMVREAAGQGGGSVILADFLQFVRRVRHLYLLLASAAFQQKKSRYMGRLWNDAQSLQR